MRQRKGYLMHITMIISNEVHEKFEDMVQRDAAMELSIYWEKAYFMDTNLL